MPSPATPTFWGWDSTSWTAFGALGAWAYAVLVCASLIGLWLQLRHSRRATQLSATLPAVLMEMNRGTAIFERRVELYRAYCNNPHAFALGQPFPVELRPAAHDVLIGYGRIGLLLKHDLVDDRLIQDWLESIPLMLWIVIRNFVEEEATRRHRVSYVLPLKRVVMTSLNSHAATSGDQPLVIFNPDNPGDVHEIQTAELDNIRTDIEHELRQFGWINPWTPQG